MSVLPIDDFFTSFTDACHHFAKEEKRESPSESKDSLSIATTVVRFLEAAKATQTPHEPSDFFKIINERSKANGPA